MEPNSMNLRERIANLPPQKREALARRLRELANGTGSTGEKQLVAYVVPTSGNVPNQQQLRDFLKKKLPDYMLPTAIRFLDAMPRTPNGKVDVRALQAAAASASETRRRFIPPQTAIERSLAQIWSEVLGEQKVGREDNFISLGGHSLLAIRVVSRLRKAFDVAVPIALLFETDTLGELAAAIEKLSDGATAAKLPPLLRIPRDGELPLSLAQQGLWFLDQLEPGNAFYNVYSSLRLTGRLDQAILQRSLGEIARRHEVLRTIFVTVEGRPLQVIVPFNGFSLPVVDLSRLGAAERERQLIDVARQHAKQSFDLSKGPLIKVTLVRLADADHAILIAAHHAVADLWSAGLFLRELGQIYKAFSEGNSTPLPELPIQYVDFSAWERSLQNHEVMDVQLAYWKKQLSHVPEMLSLPFDRPRPATQSYHGSRIAFTVSRTVSEALQAIGKRHSATPFVTLLAAFQVLLHRYTGQTDICVAAPVAYRNHADLENLIGYFMHTVVLRADLSGDPTFDEFLTRVRDAAFEAQANQDIPAEKVLEALQIERALNRNPLTQIGFALQNAMADVVELPGLKMDFLDVHNETTKADLTLLMMETSDTYSGLVEYSTDLFDASTITNMFAAFQTLLESIAADPRQPISRLRLTETIQDEAITTTEKQSLPSGCVHELIERQTAATPDSLAVSSEAGQLTFRALNARANQVAHYLHSLGIGKGALVAVCMDRAPELIIAVLGTLKAGAAYVPLDPAYPPDRLAAMLEDARVALVLTKTSVASNLPANGAQFVCLDSNVPGIAEGSTENIRIQTSSDDRIYAIFTSGSTGKPKLAGVQHRGFSNLMRWFVNEFNISASDRTLLMSSFNFDLTQKNLFAPLITGGCLHLLSSDAYDPEQIRRAIDGNQITLLNCTPSAFLPLIDEIDDAALVRLQSLRLLFLGGEPIVIRRFRKWIETPRFHAQIVNTYGPTECTDICAFYRVEDPGLFIDSNVPIGRAIPNARVYVLDSHLALLPMGAIGELCVGGEGVGEGYLNDPELTSSKFVKDPFNKQGGRLYRTGDLVRYQPNGSLEFIGRIDHQVKIRGFRIEPGEIEAVLEQHASVKQCVVMAREDVPGQKRLVAYVVFQAGQAATTNELRQFVRTKLPDYMVPASFVTLDVMPLTPNGKIDRLALPPDATEIVASTPYAPPVTANEIALAKIVQEVLRRDRVGIHDNFFELGGDSILAIQAVSRANRIGIRINPRQLFQYQTIAELAAVAGTGPAIQAEQGIVKGPVPLTPIQRHFFAETAVDLHHFNQSVLFEVQRRLDAQLLERAVHKVLAHHDALRMRYKRTEKGWEQRNAGGDEASSRPVFVYVDLSGCDESMQKQQIETMADQLQGSLDLTKGPIIRTAYFDLGTDRPSRLFIVVHHLVVDGLSWRVLLEDLLLGYEQLNQGHSVELPPKTTSFQQWAIKLSEYGKSEAALKEKDYWLQVCRAQKTRLPVDFPGGANTLAACSRVGVSLTAAETQSLLQEVLGVYHTQINDLLLTALLKSMSPWSGHKSLTLALEGHGREALFEDADVSRTVGWFTSIYPIHIELPESNTIAEELKSVKEQLRRVPNGGVGFEVLRFLSEDPEITHEFETAQRPEVTFNYLGQFDQLFPSNMPVTLAKESSGSTQSLRAARTQLLDVVAAITNGQLQINWFYCENIHRRSTIETLADRFVTELRALVTHCKSPDAGGYTPSDFPDASLTQEDLDDLLEELDESIH